MEIYLFNIFIFYQISFSSNAQTNNFYNQYSSFYYFFKIIYYRLKFPHTCIPLQFDWLEHIILISRKMFFFNSTSLFCLYCFPRYFYENTAPQWSVFNRGIWRDVERLFLRNLNKATGKHLVVSGTLNSTYLIPSKTIAQKPFVLQWPDSIPVPLVIWRMIYNIDKNKGTVFLGLNYPFRMEERAERFCEEIPCPSKFGRKITRVHLIYCCSKESFEESYGPLDPVVYKQFWSSKKHYRRTLAR